MKRFLLLLLAPGLGCAAAETPVVRVVPELTTERHIHTGPFHLGELERDRYFRSYHPPGLFSEERNQELQEIGAMPGRGSYRIERPSTAGFPRTRVRPMPSPTAAIRSGCARASTSGNCRTARWRTGKPSGSATCSGATCIPASPTGWYACSAGGKVLEWTTRATTRQWQTGDLADFHNEVARRMRQAHPEVLVGGPCYAWPYPQGDWRGWRNPSRFIELSGGDLGFYDLHFYSKGDWALPLEPRWQEQRVDHPSLYRSQRLGVGTVWDFGRLEGYLDLWNAHHLATWNGEWKPMVISEFGRQGIFPQFGPWTNDFKPFIFMSTIVRMWMTFMERPDIQLTVPFILGESDLDYAPRRGMAIYTRPRAELSRQFVELAQRLGQGLLDDPDSPPDPGLEPTRFHDFYRFFSDIRGHRIPVEIASADPAAERRLLVLGFREGETAYLWIHNGGAYPEDPVTVDLEELFRQWGRGVRNIEHKRLYFAGPVPDPHAPGEIAGLLHIDAPDAYRPLPGGRLELSGEETVVVRIRLDAELAVRGQLHEHQFFASETTVPFAGGRSAALTFSLDAADLDDLSGAVAHLGLARDGGFPARARVSINGTVAGIIDLGHSAGVTHFHAVERLRIPAGLLRAGRNRVEVDLSDTLAEGDPRLVSGRLTLLRQGKN